MTVSSKLVLISLFAAVASSATIAAAASSRSSPPPPPPAPRPAPAPAAAARIAPSPTARPAPSTVASPLSADARAATAKVSGTIQPMVDYKSVVTKAPLAALPTAARATVAQSTAGTTQSTKSTSAFTSEADREPRPRGQLAQPNVRVAGLSPEQATTLAPSVQRFESRYRDAQVVHEPTTSGWTWLFLWWALSNGDENHRLLEQNDQLRAQMQSLESDLRRDPEQWRQLQDLAAQSARNSQVVSPDSLPDEPADLPQAGSASAAAVARGVGDDGVFGLLLEALPWMVMVGIGVAVTVAFQRR